ncbi:acyltransferase family protein [Cellulomonas sp. HZM]|uniref:acyltransferase family protein n=1 Tax=Cellulomonas sp. HZM TaxID=1454010 RepID=UPI00068B67BB|nr:acyltransferase family protein [Cellulomonas sp. HZM]
MTSTGDRHPFWDNAKAVLVTLVVVGHALQPAAAAGVAVADVLYRWVYLFHMPAFVLVTGVLTAELTTRRAGRLVTGLLAPYVVFQVLQTAEVSLLRGSLAPLHLLEPRWTLWFLLAAVLWRLSAPLWTALQPSVAIGLAVVVCLLAGLGDGVGHVLALDDALGFLPFFVAGLVLRSSAWSGRLTTAPRTPVVLAGAVVLAAALVLAAVTRDAFTSSALQLGFATDDVGATAARGTALRAALLLAAAACVAAVLAVVPRRELTWTSVGRASLYVYLLHPLLLLPLRDGRWVAGGAVALATALGAVVLALVLASSPVRRVARPFVEPPLDRLLLARPGGRA